MERAQLALESGDEAEARQLLHFARLLDQRKDVQRAVPGIFDYPQKAA
ncbi:hypothetical protein [Streptomyces sp. NBC_01285]|nr:hypothetical protein [Streptomyces sp. NBC_01285]MCX4774028.1 hypothetical protein [Streptomyces sp. NBC_01285]